MPIRTSAIIALALAPLVALAACSGDTGRVRGDVSALLSQEGDPSAAVDRVTRHGSKALPYLEAALHSAQPRGRKNVIVALRRIGDAEAIPLLRHVALYDEGEDVRVEAEWTLAQWAAGKDARAERARAALREIEERRGREGSG